LLVAPAFVAGQPGASPKSEPKTRLYFIAAEEVNWSYMPRGRNLTGTPQDDTDESDTRASTETYLKAIYREYTDDTFGHVKPRAPEWEHLGILGPLIRAEVGDTIRVVFVIKQN
jgi:hypothetical protein